MVSGRISLEPPNKLSPMTPERHAQKLRAFGILVQGAVLSTDVLERADGTVYDSVLRLPTRPPGSSKCSTAWLVFLRVTCVLRKHELFIITSPDNV